MRGNFSSNEGIVKLVKKIMRNIFIYLFLFMCLFIYGLSEAHTIASIGTLVKRELERK
jgi:hypothetical protein